jgi:hypothetical protein
MSVSFDRTMTSTRDASVYPPVNYHEFTYVILCYYAHTYMHACIHTYIHTYIHTCCVNFLDAVLIKYLELPEPILPTLASCNASALKIYHATSRLVRFLKQNIFFYYEKCSSLLHRCRCSCKFRIRRVGSLL